MIASATVTRQPLTPLDLARQRAARHLRERHANSGLVLKREHCETPDGWIFFPVSGDGEPQVGGFCLGVPSEGERVHEIGSGRMLDLAACRVHPAPTCFTLAEALLDDPPWACSGGYPVGRACRRLRRPGTG